MANLPNDPAKTVTGNAANLIEFMRRLVRVPHSEIKSKPNWTRKKMRDDCLSLLLPPSLSLHRNGQLRTVPRSFLPPCQSVLHKSVSSLKSAMLPA